MPSISLNDFEASTVANYLGRKKSKKTTDQFSQVLRELRAVGAVETSDLTDTTILRWIAAWPTRTTETFHSHFRALNTLCKRAKKKGHLDENPFDIDDVSEWLAIDDRPSAPKRRWSRPADQIRAMLALADREAQSGDWDACRLRAYAHTLFLTGARPGEIQRLRLRDFDRREQSIEIVAHEITGRGGRVSWWKPKTPGSAGKIAVGRRLTQILDDWSRRVRCGTRRGRLRVPCCPFLFPGKMGWGPWTSGSKGERPLDQVKALGARAGVDGLTQKAARKGLGTYHEIGLTPLGRRELFRHSDDATGDFYDERDVNSRRGDALAIESFFYGTAAQ